MSQNNETLKLIQKLLKQFNDTFEIEANIVTEGDEQFASGLKIKSLKGNGSEFVSSFHDTFNTIVQSISVQHEVIYHPEKGLAIAKKVTEYVIEDF